MKKGAIFDMDGLLLDTERVYLRGWRETADRFGRASSPAFEKAVAGTNGAHQRDVISRFFPGVDSMAFQDACIATVTEINSRDVQTRPGAAEILAFFRGQGVKTALASASDRESILRNLRFAALEHPFDAIISGTDVARGKPAPDIFLLAAETLGLPPEDCYVFEDSVSGATAGIAAGCAAVMIPDLFSPTEELKAGCAGIFPSLLDAMEAVKAGRL